MKEFMRNPDMIKKLADRKNKTHPNKISISRLIGIKTIKTDDKRG